MNALDEPSPELAGHVGDADELDAAVSIAGVAERLAEDAVLDLLDASTISRLRVGEADVSVEAPVGGDVDVLVDRGRDEEAADARSA